MKGDSAAKQSSSIPSRSKHCWISTRPEAIRSLHLRSPASSGRPCREEAPPSLSWIPKKRFLRRRRASTKWRPRHARDYWEQREFATARHDFLCVWKTLTAPCFIGAFSSWTLRLTRRETSYRALEPIFTPFLTRQNRLQLTARRWTPPGAINLPEIFCSPAALCRNGGHSPI